MKTFIILCLIISVGILILPSTSFAGRIRKGNNTIYSTGEKFYVDTVDDYYSPSTRFYVYLEIEDNSIKIREDYIKEGNTETKTFTLPLDEQKQALLKTADNEELIITVLDEQGRIRVKKKRNE